MLPQLQKGENDDYQGIAQSASRFFMTQSEIDVCNEIALQAISDSYVKRWLREQNLENEKCWKTQYGLCNSHFFSNEP
jgi:hypothetical protein